MMFPHGGQQEQVLYRADGGAVQTMKAVRERLHSICGQYANRHVRIETIDGHTAVGRIVRCDNGLLYIAVRVPSHQRAFFGVPQYGTDEMILTLVLYELLVITLLYA